MRSGVISTRDKMLASAGLGGVTLLADDGPEGTVGVPGDGRGDGLAVGTLSAETEGIKRKHN